MRCVNSSTISNGGVNANLPLKGRFKASKVLIPTIIGQWKEYPQSNFMFPVRSPSEQSSIGAIGM